MIHLSHAVPVLVVREHVEHVVQRRHVHLQQLVQMLMVATKLQVVVSTNHSLMKINLDV